MSKAKNPETVFYQWGGGTAAFFGYTHLSHDLTTGLLPALLPLIREGLGLSYLQSGLLLSALTITSGLSQFPGGWIGDRLSQPIVIAVGLVGVGLTALAVGLSPVYYSMLAILILMGIFAGAYHPSAVSLLSSHYEPTRRGKVIALHMVGGSIGYASGPFLGGLIAEFLGWRFAFILLGLPALVAVPLIFKKFRHLEPMNPSPVGTSLTSQPKPKSFSILKVLRPVAFIFTLAIFIQLVGGTALAFIPIYLVDKHQVTPVYAAMLIGLTRGGGIIGSLLGGWLSDRWGRNKAIFLALVATGPVLLLVTRLSLNAGLILMLITFGLFMYMRQASVQPFLMDSMPPQLRATIFGIYFGLGMEGMSLAQPVAGHFMDVFGIVAVFNFTALICTGLSLVALFLVRKQKFQTSPN